MEQYFLLSSEGIKMIAWGTKTDDNMPEDAIPVALFPPAISEELVNDFLALLIQKDPDGEMGKVAKEAVEAVVGQGSVTVEDMGLEPGEMIPTDAETISPDEAAAEGPFVV